MKSDYKKLAPYIRLVDIRNSNDERYELLGVSVDKHFIKSIANTVGTDWRTYKVIKKGQFCYIPDTSRRGDKMGIALLTDYDIALVSQAYAVFEIINQDELLPEYLNLWFKRPEFDRYARFHSHGSVREIFDWEEMGNVELPIPDIKEQKKIVQAYNTIERRIELKRKINDNLVATADTIFFKMFVLNKSENRIPFTDVVQIMGGGTPKTDENDFWGGEIPFFTPKDVSDSPFCINTEKSLTVDGLNNCSSKLYPQFTTFVTCRGTVGNLAMAGVPMAMNQSCYALKGKSEFPPLFVYAFARYVIATMKRKASGAVFSALVTRDFEMEKVFEPSVDNAIIYQEKVESLFSQILANTNEIRHLIELRDTILAQLSR